MEARADGSGSVRAGLGLDDEALRELGDPAKELNLEDLRQAGWTIAGPAREPDGLTWVRAAKRFATPDEGSRALAELSGPEGPFRELRLRRSRSFLKTTTALSGLIDLSKGLAGFSDAALQQALGDATLGVDLDALRRRFGPTLDQTVRVQFQARLHGDTRSWQPRLGEQVRIASRAETWNLQPILAAIAALVFAATALVVLTAGRRR